MAQTIVFLIHGMGEQAAGWSTGDDGPVPTLTAAANYYSGFSAADPLGNAVKFVEITYNDIFEGIRERWQELADDLVNDNVPGAAEDVLTRISNLMGQATGESFAATHLLDVGLYYSFGIIQRLVQLKVSALLMQTIARQESDGGEPCEYVVIAHSLGTTIAHDAIQTMASTPWLDNAPAVLNRLYQQNVGPGVTLAGIQAAIDTHGTNPFAPGKFKFNALFQIANTSRLLSRTGSPYESAVRPMYAGDGPLGNATQLFFNVDHLLDPIGKPRRHRVEDAWPDAAWNYTAQDLFDIRHLHDINVHGFGHYLAHPLVHGNFLRVAAPDRFSAADLATAYERVKPGGDFQAIGPKYQEADVNQAIRARLSELLPDSAGELPPEVLDQAKMLLDGMELPAEVIRWGGTLLALEKLIKAVRTEIDE